MWDGNISSLGDQPLLVWAEQGYGDNIQFVRYVQILIEGGCQGHFVNAQAVDAIVQRVFATPCSCNC